MGILSKFAHKKDDSLNVSSPRSYMLHGVKIHKLTVAKYVEWLKIADDLPTIVFENAFPECENMTQLIEQLTKLNKKTMLQLVGRLLTTVPTEVCTLLANLFEFDESRLLDTEAPDALTLNELLDITTAFFEMNDYSDFFASVQRLTKAYRRMTTNTKESGGSSAG